jgi:2-dehydro-3-deoxyphosphogluconate aldolase/(4S)-4-hydroxy-2-oxoglutarate aldolase
MPFSLETFDRLPLVGILRGLSAEATASSVKAALRGGLCNLEITMNTHGAAEQICLVSEMAGDQANVGAGTVCTLELLEAALAAGASFIVTPVVAEDVIEVCVKRGVPVFPGAFTPTEIHRAWSLGATMVKLFPADCFGPSYVKAVKAPLNEIRIMPTGGVSLDNIAEYRQAGADAFGLGSPLFDSKQVAAENWDWITTQTERYVAAYHAAGK